MFWSYWKHQRTVFLGISFLLFCTIIQRPIECSAKEIVATNEWQRVKEGDTIPPGLHVRMDIETGEKWVKLIDKLDSHDDLESSSVTTSVILRDEGGQVRETQTDRPISDLNTSVPNESLRRQAIKITQLANAELTAEASAKINAQLLEQTQRRKNMIESISALNDFTDDATANETEYEMMYRSLMSLPKEELQSMNINMPLVPGIDASIEEREEFEKQLRDIWNVRQALLKKMEEEYLADVTDVIAERIQSIQMYLKDPSAEIRNILLKKEQAANDFRHDLGTIIGVLNDLEFQLTDLDNAREFHDMGGWPLLVALLTDSVHGFESEVHRAASIEFPYANATQRDTLVDDSSIVTLSEEVVHFLRNYQRIVWQIQGLACWCIGTAVKNVEEFHDWAVEDFSYLLSSDGLDRRVNVITIILEKFHEFGRGKFQLGISNMDDILQTKQKYEIYALGSLLRGNRDAIYYFDSVNGSSILLNFYNILIGESQTVVTMKPEVSKIMEKLVILIGDIVLDVKLHPSENIDFDNQVVMNLTSKEWCMIPVHIFKHNSLGVKRKMLDLLLNIHPYCTYDNHAHVMAQIDQHMVADEDLNELSTKYQEVLAM